jgi:hypothetical protein
MLINEGKWDRAIRILLGLAILMFVPQSSWGWLGLFPLLTGMAAYCPMYHLLGWSTNRSQRTA